MLALKECTLLKGKLARVLLILTAGSLALPTFAQDPKPAGAVGPKIEAVSDSAARKIAPADLASKPIKDKWALIIGISKFADQSLNLKYAAKDARDFHDYLIKEANFAPDHVKLLINEDATRENILDMLGDKWLPRAALPEDLVVIYVSSHGSPSELDVSGINYVIAHDTDKERLFSTALSLQELTQLIKQRVHSDRVVAILDTCYSGSAQTDSKGLVRQNIDADQIAQGIGQLVICSSEPTETSWESKNYPNGVFTQQLINGLRLKGAQTTLDEAFEFMRNRVQEEVVQDRGVLQRPVLRSKWEGAKLMLAVAPSSPRPAPYVVPRKKSSAADRTPVQFQPPPPQQQQPQQIAMMPAMVAIPAMSWETWVAKVQSGRQLLTKEDDSEEGKRLIELANAERDRMGRNDPRVLIDEAKTREATGEAVPANALSWKTNLDSGRKAYLAGDLNKATEDFQAALKDCERNFDGLDPKTATTLDNLGVALFYQGKLNEAAGLFKRAIGISESSNDSASLALQLEHYAACLYAQKSLPEALEAADRALALWQTEFGASHPKVASALSIIGMINTELGNYAAAESAINRSIEINKKAPWFRAPDLSQSLFASGLLLAVQNKYKEANAAFEQARKSREEQFGANLFLVPIYLAQGQFNSITNHAFAADTFLNRAHNLAKKKLAKLKDNTAMSDYTAMTANSLIEHYGRIRRPGRVQQLSSEFPTAAASATKDTNRVFSINALQLVPPSKVPNSWNVHVVAYNQHVYGKWTWDAQLNCFRAVWDNGSTGIVKGRYSDGMTKLDYTQVNPGLWGSLQVTEVKPDSISGKGTVVLSTANWEAYW
jgi:tetratricopeptide (TPR) repeat protein